MAIRSPFHQARARLQRLSDAKCFNGWVVDLSDVAVVIRMKTKPDLTPDEQFQFELHGLDRSAQFRGILGQVEEEYYTFIIRENIRYHAARENARLYAGNLAGTVTVGGVKAPVHVEDYSKGGLGLEMSMQLKRGEVYEFSVESPAGPVDFKGEIRYSKADPEKEGNFRIGVQITAMDRLAAARWSSFFTLAA